MEKTVLKVLEIIKPSRKEEQEVKDRINPILNQINKSVKDAKVILGGSGVKGTWLKDAYDADIFVKFDYKKYKDNPKISEIVERTLKKKFKIIKLHGSRDYFQIKDKSFTFEIVPILDIKKAEQAKNITDVSPLHAGWVNKKGKNLKDDVRLLKQFCKASQVYGAESYINGFSGYICEILTIHYKGFLNVIRKAAKWNDKTILDTENYWKGKDVLMELNKSKTQSPLVIIDPVQADRNAAAALSFENFEKFIDICRKFLKKPSEKFFEINELSENDLRKKAGKNNLMLIEVLPFLGKADSVGCKLVKALEFINNALYKNDFKVKNYGWQWNKKALFHFIVKKEKLSNKIKIIGPPVKLEEHVKKFKKKYKKIFVVNGKVCTQVSRKFNDPIKLIKSLKKDKYLMEKIRGFELR